MKLNHKGKRQYLNEYSKTTKTLKLDFPKYLKKKQNQQRPRESTAEILEQKVWKSMKSSKNFPRAYWSMGTIIYDMSWSQSLQDEAGGSQFHPGGKNILERV